MRLKIVLTWKRLAGLVLAGVAGALLFSWMGLVSIAASSGHFAVTGWFLHWTMQNAVRTQSLAVEMPEDLDLGDPALVRRAAGHFATGCAPCHGGPGVPQSPVVRSMTPMPPRLEGNVSEWSDRELFWIVKHGIKYSGMPAWPGEARDDEVWAQVAFLRALPEMSRERYAALALGVGQASGTIEAGSDTTAAPDASVEPALVDCARCHGRDGLGSGAGEGKGGGAFPIIAGQSEAYLWATLDAYASGRRESGFMEPPSSRYGPDVRRALARHYARQPGLDGKTAEEAHLGQDVTGRTSSAGSEGETDRLPPDDRQDIAGRLEGDARVLSFMVPALSAAGPPEGRDDLLRLGSHIAHRGIPAQKVPACESCHGAAETKRNPAYPLIAGQPEWYLRNHLVLWQRGKRGGTNYAHLMDRIARQMTGEQIIAVAAWYAEQRAGER
jgi:cytochrome c553